MELQFNKSLCSCLKTLTRQVQNQEQTQEIRLPDGLPDIGTVLGAWGQVILRSKEWHTGSMHISGGVMAWVLYMPEDDQQVQCVETWIPFQMKWEFPDSDRDGAMQTQCFLRSIDARTTSARKLMVRAGISALSQAFIKDEFEQYTPAELGDDVQLLWKKYPVCLPKEAGEKAFVLEEELTLPASCPKIQKILRYTLTPEITEEKVVSGRLAFRGTARLHVLYCSEDGGLCSWDFEIPFSQYTDLDDTYEESANAQIVPMVTGLELEVGEEDLLTLKAGLAAQYVIYDCTVLECVEDAYSTDKELSPIMTVLELPVILDSREEVIQSEAIVDDVGGKLIDAVFYPDHPRVTREDGNVMGEFPGVFQVLYYDENGKIQGSAARWEGSWTLPADSDVKVQMCIVKTAEPQSALLGGKANLRCDMTFLAETAMQKGFDAVCGLAIGEDREKEQDAPSLIVRKIGDDTLWDIAKNVGSTVERIQKVNKLTAEPEPDQMLLIPVV